MNAIKTRLNTLSITQGKILNDIRLEMQDKFPEIKIDSVYTYSVAFNVKGFRFEARFRNKEISDYNKCPKINSRDEALNYFDDKEQATNIAEEVSEFVFNNYGEGYKNV